jgi:hypothetical protein
MLRLSSKITFNQGTSRQLVYTFANEVSLTKSWSKITDTAKIVIPKKIETDGKPIAIGEDSIFKRGDTVKIELGYDDNLKVVFDGFVSRVFVKMPIIIECEDKMYSLKSKISPNLSFESVDTKTLIKNMGVGVAYNVNENQNLGKVRVSNNASVAQVLDFLRKEYSIYSYFSSDVLQIGRPYYKSNPKQFVFGNEKNIIENRLEYVNEDDQKVKVRAYGIRTEDNKLIEAFYPSKDSEGEQHQIKIDNLGNADAYNMLAKRHYEAQKYTGYRGSFTTFGAPAVEHGDIVVLQSEKIPEMNEKKYLVKQVDLRFGINGYRQEITLDRVVE